MARWLNAWYACIPMDGGSEMFCKFLTTLPWCLPPVVLWLANG